jgi:dipeptidyl aminopeptidase/acylaminoacyl peptidase
MLLLSLLLSLSLTPLEAADLEIEPFSVAQVLNKAEIAKIGLLQSGYTAPLTLSGVSPDGNYQLIFALEKGFQLLNLRDGSTKPLTLGEAFPFNLLLALLLGLDPAQTYRWVDNTTLVSLSLNSSGNAFTLASLDVSSGKTTFKSLPEIQGIPYSLSPDARKVLYLVVPGLNLRPAPAEEMARQVFSLELRVSENLSLKVATNQPRFVVLDVALGSTTTLFELTTLLQPIKPAWTADSSKIAFARTDISKPVSSIPLSNSAQLNDLVTQDALGRLSPANNPFLQGNSLTLADLNTNPVNITNLRAADGNGDIFSETSWSSDGNTLMVRMLVPSHLVGRNQPIYLTRQERAYYRFYDPQGQLLETLDQPEIDAPGLNAGIANYFGFISPDELLFSVVRGTDKPVFYYNRTTREFRRLPLPSGTVSDLQYSAASGKLSFVFTSFTQPPEFFTAGLDGANFSPLTSFKSILTKQFKYRADPVDFTLANGQKRSGWLIQSGEAEFPPQNKPVIVWQEGGPGIPMLNRFATNVENPYNLLSQFGFAVLFVPLSGREGFGKEFHNALADGTNFGQLDIDEMAEIVQQTISRGWTSKEKVGITGCSYGGYFAAQSIARYPDLYAAANVQCGLYDNLNEWQSGLTGLMSYLEPAPPSEIADEFTKDSPLYNSTRVRASTLIFHGTKDYLPLHLAQNFHDQLQANGVAVNLYHFKDEGHGLILPTSQLSAAQLQIDWFRTYLAGAGVAPTQIPSSNSKKP